MRTALLCSLCALLLLSTALPANADEIYFPDPLYSTELNVIPLSGALLSNNPTGEWRYQTQLNADWIGRAGRITEIAFLSGYNQQLIASDFEVRMSHTTLASPSTLFAANLPRPEVLLPAGPHVWTGTCQQWSPIGLQRSFLYDGTSNLTIEIRYRNGRIQGGNGGCVGTWPCPRAPYRMYKYKPGAYAALQGSCGGQTGLKIRLTIQRTTIVASGAPSPGETICFALQSYGEARLAYQVGTSLGDGPIFIHGRLLGLSLDPVLMVSVQGQLPHIFSAYAGRLDGQGKAQAALHIPRGRALIGLRLHTAYVTIESSAPSPVKSISETVPFTIMK